MKKIFPQKFLATTAILLLTLAISNAAYALTFYTKSYDGFMQNDKPSPLNTVNIQADADGEIKAGSNIGIVIPQTLFIIFDIKNRDIKFSGNAVSKVDVENFTYSDDGKILYLPIKTDFAKGDVVSIDNVIVRIYQFSTGYERLGLDLNNDGQIDAYDSNFVQILQSDALVDITPPYEITKFTYKIVADKTVLDWVFPPDLDFYKLEITNKDTNEKQFIYSKSTNELTLPIVSQKGFSAVVYDQQGLSSQTVDATPVVTPVPVVTPSPVDTTTPPPTDQNPPTTPAAPTPTPTPEFTDIANHWSKDLVVSMVEKGIIKGYEDNTFRPDNKITRAEAAAILYRVLGLAEPTLPAETGFNDVQSNAWYAGYVLELKTRQITQGYSDNTFKPDAEINRAEFLQLAVNTLLNKSTAAKQEELKTVMDGATTTKFADLKSTDWYTKIVTLADTEGYVDGQVCGSVKCFAGTSSITRAEAVKILAKIFFP